MLAVSLFWQYLWPGLAQRSYLKRIQSMDALAEVYTGVKWVLFCSQRLYNIRSGWIQVVVCTNPEVAPFSPLNHDNLEPSPPPPPHSQLLFVFQISSLQTTCVVDPCLLCSLRFCPRENGCLFNQQGFLVKEKRVEERFF